MTERLLILLAASIIAWPAADAKAQVALTPYHDTDNWFGILTAGGNVAGGGANTLGSMGHFSIGLDGSVVRPGISGEDYTAGGYSAVVRLGVMSGFTLGPGLHGTGSLDFFLKGGQMFLNADIPTDVGHLGGGARLGILRNSILAPAVSVTVSYHTTSNLQIITNRADILKPSADFSTWAVRADISKNLFFITPYAGAGFNTSEIEVTTSGARTADDKTREIFYGGVEWNIMILHLGAEIGRSGGDTYGKVGARIAL